MSWYRARIVDYEQSTKKIGQYYPVFEYRDHYGDIHTYTRKRPIEITPFTENKQYRICKKEFCTHEATEKRLAPRVYFLAIRILMLIVAFLNPSLVLFTMLVNTAAQQGYHVWKMIQKWRTSYFRNKLTQINGVIIGYKKAKRKGMFASSEPVYRPLIQYEYKQRTYIHIGKIACKEEQRIKGAICKIYIDTKRQLVVDEFEINAPLLAISSWSKESVGITRKNIVARTKRLRKDVDQSSGVSQPQLTGPSPLRSVEYKRVASWY